MENKTHIKFNKLEAELQKLKEAFSCAQPFEHVVFDGFLNPSSLEMLQTEIAEPLDSNRSNDYVFAKNKFENPAFADSGGVMAEIKEELLSDRFANILSEIVGLPLFVDASFLGGGIHQGGKGSYLDMHADFNRHPLNNDWLRTINILLYLNRDYKESYGGHLEMVHADTGEHNRVAPYENRLVLMLTKEHTLHGYKPINFPAGTYRTSLAAYAYTIDTDFDSVPIRTTLWKPKNASLGKKIAAIFSPMLVKYKNKLFGSATARRSAIKNSNKN